MIGLAKNVSPPAITTCDAVNDGSHSPSPETTVMVSTIERVWISVVSAKEADMS